MRKPESGGGGSFYNSPLRFLDQTLEFTLVSTGSAVQRSCGFLFPSGDLRCDLNSDGDISPPNGPIPDQPQFHESAPISGQKGIWEVAFMENVAGSQNLTAFHFDNPPVPGKFITVTDFSSPNAQIKFAAPTAGVFWNQSRYTIRKVADSVEYASALVLIRCTVS